MAFEKGKSGNPNGRPARTNAAALLARKHTDKAIEVLIGNLASEKEEVRHKAAEALLNRGWGMPKETHEHTGEDGGAIVQEHRGLPALMGEINSRIASRGAKDALPPLGTDRPVLPADEDTTPQGH